MKFSRIDKIWARSSCFDLDDRSTHEKNLEFQNQQFLDFSLGI
jgi:hypothetical protein